MRGRLSGPILLVFLAWGESAQGRPAAPRLHLDLPPGPLAVAIDRLCEASGVSIGASDPALLATPLPALHLEGPPAALVQSLADRAGVTAARTGPDGWRILRRASPPPPAPAAAAGPTTVAEILVQASKRPEPLKDYPAEIARVPGADLVRYGAVPDTGALSAQVPILASTDWGAGQEKLFLRGVADSSFTGASPVLVGEYLGDQPLTYEAPDPDLRLYDVASVEVLAGPQGTLYGAGALGGLIRIEPNAPVLDRIAGSAWLGASNTAHGGTGGDFGGALNLPLVEDQLGLRVVGYGAEDPGYIDDLRRKMKDVNRTDARGGRATLRWALSDRWRIDLGAVAQRIDNRDAPYADPAGPPLTRSTPFAQPSHDLFLAGSLTLAGRIGAVDVRSTTGVARQSLGERFAAGLPGQLFARFDETGRPEQVSHETRLSGGDAAASWVMGVSYVASAQTQTRDYGNYAAPSVIGRLHERTDELTGYGEATRRLIGPLSATLGLRWDQVRQAGQVVGSSSPFLVAALVRTHSVAGGESHVLPTAALSYRLSRSTTLFVRHGQGFRPSGLTLGGAGGRFTGDHLSTLEAGVRRDGAGSGRVALSLTTAFSRWRNIQADVLDGTGMPQVANIGDGRIASLDASMAVRITGGLRLQASGFLAHSRLDAPAGIEPGGANTLPDVARNGGVVALDYQGRVAGGRPWQAGLRVQHVGPSLLGVDPLLARPQGDYTTAALRAGVRIGGVDWVLNLTNLSDSRSRAFAVGTPLGSLVESGVTPLRPRTLRLGLRREF